MTVACATEPGSAAVPNEDLVLTASGLVIVLDGVTRSPDTPTGCVHGTPWFVWRLGVAVLRRSVDFADSWLEPVVAAAIEDVAEQHADTCDLAHPAAPAATVAIVRMHQQVVEYLVMGDAVVVLDDAGDVRVATDPENLAVAASHPRAVAEAVVGTLPLLGLRRAAVMSDGASRLVDEFGLADWPGMLDVLDSEGPGRLIDRVRDVERRDPACAWWPRAKRHDDASVAFWRFVRRARESPG